MDNDILESKLEKMKINIEEVKTYKVYFEENIKWIICNLDLNMLEVIPENLRDMPFDALCLRTSQLEREIKMLEKDYNEQMSNPVDNMFDEFQALYRKIVRDKVSEKTYDDKQKCQPNEHCYARFEVLVKETKTIADQFKDDKRAKRLAYNEEQIHKMDKQKLSMKCTQGMSLLTDHCELKWREQHNRLGSWFTKVYFDFQSVTILMEKIQKLLLKFTIFKTQLDELKSRHEEASKDIKQAIKDALHRKNSVYMKGSEPSHARPNMDATMIPFSQRRQRRKRSAFVTQELSLELSEYQHGIKVLRDDVEKKLRQMEIMRIDI